MSRWVFVGFLIYLCCGVLNPSTCLDADTLIADKKLCRQTKITNTLVGMLVGGHDAGRSMAGQCAMLTNPAVSVFCVSAAVGGGAMAGGAVGYIAAQNMASCQRVICAESCDPLQLPQGHARAF